MSDRTADTTGPAAASATTAGAQDGPAAAPDIGGLAGVLSAREAAAALGVSERTVRRAIQRGQLVATKHAGTFQITPAALDDYRRGEAGQRTPEAAAVADRAAAAADSGQDTNGAVTVLRHLLAEERAKSDRLLEAATIWQARAGQLEARLLALEAGLVSAEADTGEDAPLAAPDAPHAAAPAGAVPPPSRPWWRRLWGR